MGPSGDAWLCTNNKSSNLSLITGISKAGYLMKQTSSIQDEWSRFFFTLNGHSLTNYSSRGVYGTPEGDVLLTVDTKVTQIGGASPSIRVDNGSQVLLLRGKDKSDIIEWKRAIDANVAQVGDLPRAYFIKKVRRRRRKKKRFFFMLHSECITYHPSHSETAVIAGLFPLTKMATATATGETGIVINCTKRWKIFAEAKIDQIRWVETIARSIKALRSREAPSTLLSYESHFPGGATILNGFLTMRDETGSWDEHFFVLTKDAFHRVRGRGTKNETIETFYSITPNTIVSSTNLNSFSFEVVTFSEVLHLNAASQEDKSKWISTSRGLVSSRSEYSREDPLQEASLSREAKYYDVFFESTESPGLVLERRGQWALVTKVTHSLRQSVFVGSILVAVNGESVVIKEYDYVVKLLSDWKPPLTLRFCSPPKKKGWLQQLVYSDWPTETRATEVRGRGKQLSRGLPSWEKAFIELGGGKLIICDGHDNSSLENSFLLLRGSAVALVPPQDVRGHCNCFRVMSGLDSMILQASTYEEMMDWATSLVHAISIENGGGFLQAKICDTIHSFASPLTKESPSSGITEYRTQEAENTSKSGTIENEVRIDEDGFIRSVESDFDTHSNHNEGSEMEESYDSSSYMYEEGRKVGESETLSLLNSSYQPSDATELAGGGDRSEPNFAYDFASSDNFDLFLGAKSLESFEPEGFSKLTLETRSVGTSIEEAVPTSNGFAIQEARKDEAETMPGASSNCDSVENGSSTSYEGEQSWIDFAPLSDEEIGSIYADTIGRGDGVNPLAFSKLVRSAEQGSTAAGNPFDEMTLFSQFSIDGHGVLGREDFFRGVRRVEEEDGVECSLYQGLIQHVRERGAA